LFARYAAAGSKNRLLGAVNSVQDADAAVQKVDALMDAADEGKWGLVSEDGPKYTPLVLALSELKGIEPKAADVIVKGLSKSEQAKLRGTSRIAGIIARLKSAKSEGDDLLDSIGLEHANVAQRFA
jgi:hypothetical protein